MRSDAQIKAEQRRNEKSATMMLRIDRDKNPEAAMKLDQQKYNAEFKKQLCQWIVSRW
jgi:DNA-dependent RNA polymerase auxiliary subunit epsilon